MTRREFYKKFKPAADRWLYEYRGDGYAAVDEAFDIACVKEMIFRLDYEADDQVDDIPWLDEVSPEWFLNEFQTWVDDYDNAAEILLPGDAGYEAYCSAMKHIEQEWKETKNGEEQGTGTDR